MGVNAQGESSLPAVKEVSSLPRMPGVGPQSVSEMVGFWALGEGECFYWGASWQLVPTPCPSVCRGSLQVGGFLFAKVVG